MQIYLKRDIRNCLINSQSGSSRRKGWILKLLLVLTSHPSTGRKGKWLGSQGLDTGGRAVNHVANAEEKEPMRLKMRIPVASKWVDRTWWIVKTNLYSVTRLYPPSGINSPNCNCVVCLVLFQRGTNSPSYCGGIMEMEIRKMPIGRLRVIYLFTWSLLATAMLNKKII